MDKLTVWDDHRNELTLVKWATPREAQDLVNRRWKRGDKRDHYFGGKLIRAKGADDA